MILRKSLFVVFALLFGGSVSTILFLATFDKHPPGNFLPQIYSLGAGSLVFFFLLFLGLAEQRTTLSKLKYPASIYARFFADGGRQKAFSYWVERFSALGLTYRQKASSYAPEDTKVIIRTTLRNETAMVRNRKKFEIVLASDVTFCLEMAANRHDAVYICECLGWRYDFYAD